MVEGCGAWGWIASCGCFYHSQLGGQGRGRKDGTQTLEASQPWPLINLNDYVTEFVRYKVLQASEKIKTLNENLL